MGFQHFRMQQTVKTLETVDFNYFPKVRDLDFHGFLHFFGVVDPCKNHWISLDFQRSHGVSGIPEIAKPSVFLRFLLIFIEILGSPSNPRKFVKNTKHFGGQIDQKQIFKF